MPTQRQIFAGVLVLIGVGVAWWLWRSTRARKVEGFAPPPPLDPAKTRVIIVPGLGGSVLQGSWNFPSKSLPHFWCSSSGSGQLWPSMASVYNQSCWAQEFGTTIPPSRPRGISSNADVGVVGWGNLSGISTLLSLDIGFLDIPVENYFKDVISALTKAGYVDIVGAPYDFRTITNPQTLSSFYHALDGLVLEAASNVVILGHSLGCALTSGYLAQASATSLAKIKKFVAVAGPFDGAPKALESVISGSQIGVPLTSDEFMKSLEATLGGVIAMIPTGHGPLGTYDDLVVDPRASSLAELMALTGNEPASEIYQGLSDTFWSPVRTKPKVPVTLIHGNLLPTIGKLDYSSSVTNPKITYIEGDGTVPMASLQAPISLGWNPTVYVVPKGDHFKILMDSYFLENLPQWISEP